MIPKRRLQNECPIKCIKMTSNWMTKPIVAENKTITPMADDKTNRHDNGYTNKHWRSTNLLYDPSRFFSFENQIRSKTPLKLGERRRNSLTSESVHAQDLFVVRTVPANKQCQAYHKIPTQNRP